MRARDSPRTVDEYAERHIVLSDDSPWPGPLRYARMALWRPIAQACSPGDPCHQITIKGAVQIGKSTLINAVLAYYADADPSPMGLILPTAEDAPDYLRERLRKLYASSPRLASIAGKRADINQRDNAQVTEFTTGARLLVLGSTAKGTYRSKPLRIVVLDDVDAYRPAPEGDHVELAIGRTGAYRMLGRKVIVCSSPGAQPSIVDREYDKGTQEQLWVPCPHCQKQQVLDPVRLVWDRDLPMTAHIECAYADCAERITQGRIPAMVRAGQWRALRPERHTTHRSFWVWQGYVPLEFAAWPEYAQASIESMRALREDNDEKPRQTFQNLRNARAWEPAASRRLTSDAAAAYERAEVPWDNETLPLIIRTASTDCQHDRLETTILGWGRGREAWALDHAVHRGSIIEDEVWDQACTSLIEQKANVWIVDAADGQVHDDICDQMTRLFDRLREAGILAWAIHNNPGMPPRDTPNGQWPKPVHPGNPKKGKFAPVSIWADSAIGWVYEALRKEARSGPNVLHVPKREPFARTWYRQVYTKRRKTRGDRPGRSSWIKPNQKARDEALDCLTLGRVALEAVLTQDERGNTLIPGIRQMILGPEAEHPQHRPDVRHLLDTSRPKARAKKMRKRRSLF